mmetsp:Transcript_73584/g.225059  ORF Transcript_73584/g.225059 Transcript_73584/m.225059 type:complete len:270 (-) Transcript_73584:684-1493(-)
MRVRRDGHRDCLGRWRLLLPREHRRVRAPVRGAVPPRAQSVRVLVGLTAPSAPRPRVFLKQLRVLRPAGGLLRGGRRAGRAPEAAVVGGVHSAGAIQDRGPLEGAFGGLLGGADDRHGGHRGHLVARSEGEHAARELAPRLRPRRRDREGVLCHGGAGVRGHLRVRARQPVADARLGPHPQGRRSEAQLQRGGGADHAEGAAQASGLMSVRRPRKQIKHPVLRPRMLDPGREHPWQVRQARACVARPEGLCPRRRVLLLRTLLLHGGLR